MSRKKRKHSSTPRRKRFNKSQRLASAKQWLASYTGTRLVRSYRKHFGVDWQCAFIELEFLGVEIDPVYKQRVLQSVATERASKKQRKAQREMRVNNSIDPDQDERFAYIAGYTSWGFPYGVTWEEMAMLEQNEEMSAKEDFSEDMKYLGDRTE